MEPYYQDLDFSVASSTKNKAIGKILSPFNDPALYLFNCSGQKDHKIIVELLPEFKEWTQLYKKFSFLKLTYMPPKGYNHEQFEKNDQSFDLWLPEGRHLSGLFKGYAIGKVVRFDSDEVHLIGQAIPDGSWLIDIQPSTAGFEKQLIEEKLDFPIKKNNCNTELSFPKTAMSEEGTVEYW